MIKKAIDLKAGDKVVKNDNGSILEVVRVETDPKKWPASVWGGKGNAQYMVCVFLSDGTHSFNPKYAEIDLVD